MRPRDFLLLVLVCLIWGFGNVLSKIVIGHWHIPPLFFAATRFSIVAVLASPWLLPMPRPRWRIIAIGLLMGAGGFALFFTALKTASPSSVAVVAQLSTPITALLAVTILGEHIGWRRGMGIALTVCGVVLVLWRPSGVVLSFGLWFMVGSAFANACGAILIKQMENVTPLRFQAWVGMASALPLIVATSLFEHDQWALAQAAGWPFLVALIFSAIIMSMLAHSIYYWLIGQYEANLISPLTLMTPLATIVLGLLLTGDEFDTRMAVGAALALGGVLIVSLRQPQRVEREI